jgi:hypothetical protein
MSDVAYAEAQQYLPAKRPVGREPIPFKDEYNSIAYGCSLMGASERELCNILQIERNTLYKWKELYPEFANALRKGAAIADAEIATKLYHRAHGFEHKVTKVFLPAGSTTPVYAEYMEDVLPDVAACIIWLKNRQPDKWRDYQRTIVDVNVKDDLSPEIRALLATLLDLASPQATIIDASAQDALTDSSKKPTE